MDVCAGTCEASGTHVLCDCDDPEICTCIVKSLPPDSIFRKEADLLNKFTDQPVSYRNVIDSSSVKRPTVADVKRRFKHEYVEGSVLFVPKDKRQGRRWWHAQQAIGNELVAFISGDIKKRSEGRKSGRKSVAPWAAGNAAQVKAGKQERSLARRQVKKYGRLRGTMVSKRCNYTFRDVIMPKIYGGMDTVYFPLAAKKCLSVCG